MVRKTLKIRLGKLTNEKQQVLDNALLWSNEVAQYYVDIFNNSFCKNKQKIHHETYPYIRAKWSKLNSKCVQWIRDKCIASFRPEKTKSIRVPVMADCQSFKVFWKDEVHIKHFQGILRLWRTDFPLILSQWHFEQLDAAKRLLYIEIFKNRKGQWYCHLVGEYEEKPTTGFRMMGVDCGINNVAVTSTSRFFGGKRVVHQRNEFRKHKRKQSGIRLRNYVRDINHKVSRAIVNEAVQQGVSVIRLERLKYYREKQLEKEQHPNPEVRHEINHKKHSWAYAQLQSFITYKAQLEGIGIEFVNPAFTSQVCSKCGRLGCRTKHEFECPHCGFRCHADLNASRNICKGIAFADGVFESTPPTDAQSVGNPHPLWVG